MAWTLTSIQTAIDAIEARIEGHGESGIQSYTLPDGREITKMRMTELIQLHQYLKAEKQRLQIADDLADDAGNRNKIKTRFI